MSKFYVEDGNVYTINQIDEFIEEVKSLGIETVYKRKGKKRYRLLNASASFDIETTSYTENDDKVSFMYIFMFGINGVSIYGRTWDEFIILMDKIEEEFDLSLEKRLPIYVHNLAFEFQFIRKYFDWEEVFCLTERKPIYALTTSGFEFRCSYILTGCKLEKVGEDLLKYKCTKKVNDLDYDLVRTSETLIDETELGYCISDIRVVMCKIRECIEAEGDVGKIPLTKTGYVRRAVKEAVLDDKKANQLVKGLKLSVEEYEMLHKAFQGGFTHANVKYSGITQNNVVSYDFTSSYPTVMLSEQFPMGNGRKVEVETVEEFMEYTRTYCCLFEIIMYDVELKKDRGDAPISRSRCTTKGNVVADNGRIRQADEIVTVITEQDFMTYRKFYTFEYQIGTMYIYPKAYLPKPIIEITLDYYLSKTTLKDVVGREADYMQAKSDFNSIFGMMVMDIVRDQIVYNGDWGKKPANVKEAIEEYNNSKTRFNWYPWGVWVTAYARKNLFTGIYECDNDYIYSDTDSIKILNADRHDSYIMEYNRQITEKLEACIDYYGLDKAKLSPKTIKGVSKPLGIWDFDGKYKKFKTLGAKRYMVETEDGEIKTTIAGVGKKSGANFLKEFDNPFEKFEDGLKIPKEKTGKLTHTYIDDVKELDVTDYLGNTTHIRTLSGVHLEKAPFEIGLSDEYRSLMQYLQFGYEDETFK